jgi:hypothetical protein
MLRIEVTHTFDVSVAEAFAYITEGEQRAVARRPPRRGAGVRRRAWLDETRRAAETMSAS